MEIGKKYLVKIPSVMEILPTSAVCVFEAIFQNVKYLVVDGEFIDVYGEEIELSYDTDSETIIISYNQQGISLNDSETFLPVMFVGELSEVNESGVEQFYDDEWLSTLTYQSVNDVFILYQLDHYRNVVTKSNNTFIDIIGGSYKEQIDIINPSILIQYDDVPNFNYVYIPSLKRYYFVNKVICVRANLYQIDLHVDVLYSFDEDIRVQSGLITRNANQYSTYLADTRRPTRNEFEVTYTDIYSNVGTGLVNVAFSFDNVNGYRYVLDNLSSAVSVVYSTMNAPSGSNLPSIASIKSEWNLLTAMTDGVKETFLDAIVKRSDLASYITSFMVFPFDITSVVTYSTNSTICVNDEYLTSSGFYDFDHATGFVYGRRLTQSASPYLIIADFTIPFVSNPYQRYLSFEPYSYYELSIPFVSWVKLNSKDVVGKRLIVFYVIDYNTGFANAFIKNMTDNKIIFGTTCQLGVKIPINTTNAEELTRQKQNNVLNMTLGLISSGVSTGVGISTLNPLAVTAGILSVSKTIATFVNSENMMFERGQVTFGTSEIALHTPIDRVILKTSRHTALSIDENKYKTLQGYPLNTYDSLSSYTGYTEVGEMKYIPSNLGYITNNEIDEIETLARNGIIL